VEFATTQFIFGIFCRLKGKHHNSIPAISIIVYQDSNSVKAPEFSHTAGRVYAVVKDGVLKHLAYYDEKHQQAVSIDFCHPHKKVQPHRHVHMSHNKNDPGISPTPEELKLANRIKKEFNLK